MLTGITKYIFISLFIVFSHSFSQEFLSSAPGERVTDPFSTNHHIHRFFAIDSSNSVKIALNYEKLFGMNELQNISLGSHFKIYGSTGGAVDLHYFHWGPFTNIETNTGLIHHFHELISTLMINIKYRYYNIDPVYTTESFQIDLSGSIYFDPKLDFFWSVKNIFEWETEGPVQGSMAAGLIYRFCPELKLHLGLEKNYLFQADSWGSISGTWKETLSYGISYLSLEDEFSAFVGIKVSRYQLEVGISHHPDLGQSYRSGVSIWL